MTGRTHRALWIALVLLLAVPGALGAQGTGVERVDGAVRIDFQGTELRLAVAALAEAAGLNVIYGNLPQAGVNLRTPTPVPVSMVRTYLESILAAHGMRLEEQPGGLLRVVGGEQQPGGPQFAPPPQGGGTLSGGDQRIFIYPLRHAPAEDMARTIGALFGIATAGGNGGTGLSSLSEELRSQRFDPSQPAGPAARTGLPAGLAGNVNVIPDPRTNSLVIRASPGDYETIAAAIAQLDTRPLQVLIEVVIAEVRRNRQFSLGIDLNVPNQRDPDSGITIGGGLSGGGTGDLVLRVLDIGRVRADVVLSALASSGQATILSRPVVLAQNNEEARILVGDQRPFIQISRALPTDNAARDQVVQYRDVGTQLTIRPTINPDGYVTMELLQEVNSATGETQFGAPVVSTREVETRLLVRDGHTVVIGGLIDQQRSVTSSGIPFLKDIPLIGNLFKSQNRQGTVTELFLFIVPHVLASDEAVDRATGAVRQSAPRLNRELPDSIPLYWELHRDSTAAPRPGQPGAPVPPGGTPPAPGQPQAFVSPSRKTGDEGDATRPVPSLALAGAPPAADRRPAVAAGTR